MTDPNAKKTEEGCTEGTQKSEGMMPPTDCCNEGETCTETETKPTAA